MQGKMFPRNAITWLSHPQIRCLWLLK